jgi:exo-beta-1,3-glucanase (GH17 family)
MSLPAAPKLVILVHAPPRIPPQSPYSRLRPQLQHPSIQHKAVPFCTTGRLEVPYRPPPSSNTQGTLLNLYRSHVSLSKEWIYLSHKLQGSPQLDGQVQIRDFRPPGASCTSAIIMPVGRTFSFEVHDEGALSPTRNEQEPLTYPSPYHDQTPSRDVISPPPQYFSPPPPELASPTPGAGRHQNYPSQDYSRRRPVSPPSQIVSLDLPPPPPPHRVPVDEGNRDSDYEGSRAYRIPPAVTPGMDNFGDNIQGGGIDHVARSVADQRQRESGIEAQRAIDAMASRHTSRSRRRRSSTSPENGIPRRPINRPERASYGSNMPLATGAATPGSITPVTSPMHQSSRRSDRSLEMYQYPAAAPLPGGYLGNYHDSPYMQAGQRYNATVSDASINPYDIADDGDDGFMPEPKRRSILSASRQTSRERAAKRASKPPSSAGSSVAPAAPIGVAAIGAAGVVGAGEAIPVGHRWGRKKKQIPSGNYDPARQGGVLDGAGNPSGQQEKQWFDEEEEKRHRKKTARTVALVIGLVIVLAVIGGIVGGVLGNRTNSSGSNSDNTAAGDTAANGDLGLNSPEIIALMNNKNLHKVFPGIDYTPWGTQYPACLTYPPSQNNVTRDMAVLSQLTNAVRLYGTDCNQTEMVLHSIDRLGLTNMKVWLGVWIDYSNMTTTDRQIDQMYKIISETSDKSIFKGAIIGNEVLYRSGNDPTVEADLVQTITDIKTDFTSLGYDMLVGTSDLGDNWNGQLTDACDFVMSNIHPFFAGVSAEAAAAWTLNFWDTHDLVLTASGTGTDSGKRQIISETGWPSGGGTDCGGATGACATGQAGSVAGVAGMNTYLDSWVCDALSNGTEYFW